MRRPVLILALVGGLLLAACGGADDSTTASTTTPATTTPTPSALPLDATLRAAVPGAYTWTDLDAVATGARFGVTTVPVPDSIFDAYWAGRAEHEGTPIVAAVLHLTPESDDAGKIQRVFGSQWTSRSIAGTSVYSAPEEELLLWYDAPNVIAVGADDGAVALAVVEAMLGA